MDLSDKEAARLAGVSEAFVEKIRATLCKKK